MAFCCFISVEYHEDNAHYSNKSLEEVSNSIASKGCRDDFIAHRPNSGVFSDSHWYVFVYFDFATLLHF